MDSNLIKDGTVIVSNGQEYLVGENIHGWFSIQQGYTYKGEFYQEADSHSSFNDEGAEKLKEELEEFL